MYFSLYFSFIIIADMIEERAAEKQFTSLGLVMHSQGGGLVICGGKDREKILTANKVESGDNEEWQLFSTLISKYIRFVSSLILSLNISGSSLLYSYL